jgi:diguanylate cyclase (GGDEF) domain
MAVQWSVFPYASMVTVSAVMCAIAGLLFVKWRNKHYLHMSLNMALLTGAAVLTLGLYSQLSAWALFGEGMLMLGYAIQQVGLIRLYRPRLDQKLYVHLAALVLFGLASAFALSNPVLVGSYMLMLLALLFAAYSFFFTARTLGMRLNYVLSTGLFACHAVFYWLSVILNQPGVKHFSVLLMLGVQALVLLLMIERMIELMQAATYSSSRDEKTGLYARRYFMQLLHAGIRSGSAAGYILIRLEGLEEFRKEMGKEACEQLTRVVAEQIRRASEPQGYAGLSEGEDMAVLLVDRSAKAAVVAEKLRQHILKAADIEVSIGYVTVHPDSSAEDILQKAEQTVQLAAAAGKNQIFGHDALPRAN